jgi:hypothetical protein
MGPHGQEWAETEITNLKDMASFELLSEISLQ